MLSTAGDMQCDAVIVGSGLGGSPFAYGLARRGFSVSVVDEGEQILHRERDLARIHVHRFADKPNLSGLAKFYGASMYRLREMDCRDTEMEAGIFSRAANRVRRSRAVLL